MSTVRIASTANSAWLWLAGALLSRLWRLDRRAERGWPAARRRSRLCRGPSARLSLRPHRPDGRVARHGRRDHARGATRARRRWCSTPPMTSIADVARKQLYRSSRSGFSCTTPSAPTRHRQCSAAPVLMIDGGRDFDHAGRLGAPSFSSGAASPRVSFACPASAISPWRAPPRGAGDGLDRRGRQSQSGTRSSAIICSMLWRGRITAKRAPSTSTSGTSGREL